MNYTFDTSGNVSGLGTVGCGAVTSTGAITSNGGAISYSNDQNATLSVAASTGTTAGKNLTIVAGSSTTGTNNINGGNLTLSSGSGDGTGTSAMIFNTKVNGTDAAAERMRIHTNGNVGISATDPGSLLEVRGPIGTGAGSAGVLTLSTAEPSVRVGTVDQLGRIDFQAPKEAGGTDAILVGASITAVCEEDFSSSNNSTALTFSTGTTTAPIERMRIDQDGNVGIGTSSPTKGALHVENHLGVSATATGAGYLASGGEVSTWGGEAGNVSIYSKLRLWCDNTIIASSDSRIKTNIEELVDDEALIKFRQLKPCKYNYIDVFQRGNDQVYGFLADEVKTILSNAVSTCNNHIPNVYKSALYNNNTITFQEPHNLDTDGNIQLYLPDNTKIFVPYTVGDTLKINIDVSNLSDNEKPSNDLVQDEDGNYLANNIFVYGTEVDDFHRLDKSAIWTTGVAALQEVDRQLQAEKAKTATLETQVTDLLARVTALENP